MAHEKFLDIDGSSVVVDTDKEHRIEPSSDRHESVIVFNEDALIEGTDHPMKEPWDPEEVEGIEGFDLGWAFDRREDADEE